MGIDLEARVHEITDRVAVLTAEHSYLVDLINKAGKRFTSALHEGETRTEALRHWHGADAHRRRMDAISEELHDLRLELDVIVSIWGDAGEL